MSLNSYECQQPSPSFSGWFPHQPSHGKLSLVANKEAPSTRFSSPKPGFLSPPDGVSYYYLLEFPPAPLKCLIVTGVIKGWNVRAEVAQPPFNLIIVTKMNLAYYSNGEKNCKLLNMYFHCWLKCVRQKQPYFLPTMCKIPPKLTPFLLHCHKDVFNNKARTGHGKPVKSWNLSFQFPSLESHGI